MHATHDVLVGDALRSVRAASDARRAADGLRMRCVSADLHHWAGLIADHHGVSEADVIDAFTFAPVEILSLIDTPTGLATLGLALAEGLGGDASRPLAVPIH